MDEVLVAIESSDPLVARLVAFCDQHDVEAAVAKFCQRHVEAFDALDGDAEHAHAVYDLFRQYESLFADVVDEFLELEGLTAEAFFQHCDTLKQTPQRHRAALDNLALLLSAALDFGAFCDVMRREARQTRDAREDASDMGL